MPSSPGDLNDTGDLTITDVQCSLLVATMATAGVLTTPACLQGPLATADLDCSGEVTVGDAVMTILAVLAGGTSTVAGFSLNPQCHESCGGEVTCESVLSFSPESGSGVYWVDPDGSGGYSAFEVYCEMERQGGGWALAATHADFATKEFADIVFPISDNTTYGVLPDHKWQPLIATFHVGLLTIDEFGNESVLPYESAVSANCHRPSDCDSLLPPPGSGYDSPCIRSESCPTQSDIEGATDGPEDAFYLYMNEVEGCCGDQKDYSIIVLFNAPTLVYSASVYNLAGLYPTVTTGSVWSVWPYTKEDGSPLLTPYILQNEIMVFVR